MLGWPTVKTRVEDVRERLDDYLEVLRSALQSQDAATPAIDRARAQVAPLGRPEVFGQRTAVLLERLERQPSNPPGVRVLPAADPLQVDSYLCVGFVGRWWDQPPERLGQYRREFP